MFICARCGNPSQDNSVGNKIMFMRHGKTQMNLDNICVGSIDEPICKLGVEQSQEAAEEFVSSGEKVDVIFSSPLKRARTTAEIFAKKLGVPLYFSESLSERDAGEIQGKPETPESEALLLKYDYLPKGATPLVDFEKETSLFLKGLDGNEFGNNTLLVTHGFRMLTIIKLIKGWNVDHIMRFTPPSNCQIITFFLGEPCKSCNNKFYELR